MHHDDLRWYFRESASACGLRSSQSAIEYVLRLGCTVSGSPSMSDRAITDRLLDAWRRERAIHARLAQLSFDQQCVLEAHFGCVETIQDIGLDLIVATHAARVAYHQAIETTVRILEQRGRVGASRRAREALSVRAWVLWLAAQANASERFRSILDEATGLLSDAMRAYELTEREAA